MPGQFEDSDDSEHLDYPDQSEKENCEESDSPIKLNSPEELGYPAYLQKKLSSCALL